MKSISIIACSIVLLIILNNYCDAKKIVVRAKLGFCPNDNEVENYFDDDKQTVRDIAEAYCKSQGFSCDGQDETEPKVRNKFGFHYKLNEIIKNAGIKDRQLVYVKWY